MQRPRMRRTPPNPKRSGAHDAGSKLQPPAACSCCNFRPPLSHSRGVARGPVQRAVAGTGAAGVAGRRAAAGAAAERGGVSLPEGRRGSHRDRAAVGALQQRRALGAAAGRQGGFSGARRGRAGQAVDKLQAGAEARSCGGGGRRAQSTARQAGPGCLAARRAPSCALQTTHFCEPQLAQAGVAERGRGTCLGHLARGSRLGAAALELLVLAVADDLHAQGRWRWGGARTGRQLAARFKNAGKCCASG